MGLTWGPSGADRTQVGPMLASRTLLFGITWGENWRIYVENRQVSVLTLNSQYSSGLGTIVISEIFTRMVPQMQFQTAQNSVLSLLENHIEVISSSWIPKDHDDVIKWQHFPRYWPFVRGIYRSPVNFPHKGQWRGALMGLFFFFICPRINGWVNNREAGDLGAIVPIMTYL